jgi:fatty-acid desaturase
MKNTLFLFHILTHLSFVPMIIYGELYHWGVAVIVYFFTGCIGMSGTYHRLLAHKSYNAPRWWEIFGTICATIGGTGSSVAWTAVHRAHHRFTDTDQDPHCPHHKGIFWVQFLSMFYQPNIKYVPDLLRDKFHVFAHKYYWGIHLIYATAIFTIDPFSIVYAWLVPSLMLWHAGSAVNTLGHLWGQQDYNIKKDSSTNHPLLGIFMWGEGWHNNHHAFPGNYRFGQKWWQIDITRYVIELIRKP